MNEKRFMLLQWFKNKNKSPSRSISKINSSGSKAFLIGQKNARKENTCAWTNAAKKLDQISQKI